jgi:hypothetical protein
MNRVSDGLSDWLMEQYIIMARHTNTPAIQWEEMPLKRFFKWIRAHNAVIQEENERYKQ